MSKNLEKIGGCAALRMANQKAGPVVTDQGNLVLDLKMNKKVVCKDGFTMSVQAGETQYCYPRETGADRYTEVEIGFPNEPEDLLLEFAEDGDRPTETVYAYVPASLVTLVIAKHGGMVSGELPPGIPYLRAQL